jgi:acetyl-CoA carboxylase carboxyl transferase subunit beta
LNWLKNFVPPKLRNLVGVQKDIPDNLWHKCPGCTQMIFHRDLDDNKHVCQHCGHHLRLRAEQRLKMIFDNEKFALLELAKPLTDPLKFRDLKKYTDRIKEARAKTGDQDALKVGLGDIGGHKAVVAVFDFAYMGGSMGMAVGDGLVTAARRAVSENVPLVVMPSSGGARMQEGILSLMQMTRTTIAVEEVKEAGLPYIVVLTDPTTGGVTASFAMLGDIQIAEPGCQIGFAGKRVIEQTIRETLPDGFQQAEYLLDHGMVDMVVHRHELSATLARIIGLLTNSGIESPISDDDLPVPPVPVTEQTDSTAAAASDG